MLLKDAFGGGTLLDLVVSNPPADPLDGRPGMYCVGVMEQALPKKGKLPEIAKERITKTNRVSIGAMIIWSNGPTSAPNISHFFAGDMDQKSEQLILN